MPYTGPPCAMQGGPFAKKPVLLKSPHPPLMRVLLLPLLLAAPLVLHATEFGVEEFAYADNSAIAGKNGGSGFNYDTFDKAVTTTTSDWDNAFGAPTVASGKLVTDNSGAKREYNGDIEGAGTGANDGQD